ncbi:Integral membrane protein YggT, involved in response to extracytoplasmic stress (osmotic shock) [hydrothermal vent metagenome]|uniref:Integral membrane protein YggT, involved in response to extracytoplasmic stress (Osmotic shock) n=1 Tax=hydrothermal vent metagenome TaxID=652676 RepID=A0A3B0SLN0_9ZZZZ
MLIALLDIVGILLNVAITIIIVQAIMSWLLAFNVINLQSDIVRAIWQTLDGLTAPLYKPIRRIMPDFGSIDLTPMVVIIGIIISQRLLDGVRYEMLIG